MKQHSNIGAVSAKPYGKFFRNVTLALFLLAASLPACAGATPAPAGTPRCPAITIYVGSG